MSTEVKVKFKETLKSATDLLKSLRDATNEQLRKTSPKVVNCLDLAFDDASKAFSDVLDVIDGRTTKEQLELLKVYRHFLTKQTELIEGRMDDLQARTPKEGEAPE